MENYMTLHKDKNLFSDVIEATAEAMKIPEVYVEKDYWLCYLLKNLSLSPYKTQVVFKGGTSLSKIYQMIERFSEDIDLGLLCDEISASQVKPLIKKIEATMLDQNFKEVKDHSLVSKGSKFRKTVFEYPRITSGNFGHASHLMVLEINSFTTPSPYAMHSMASFITHFLQTSPQKELITQHALEPFEVQVLDIRRTFCEKVSAIAKASYLGQRELENKVRHFYDLYFLMKEPSIVEFLETDEFISFFKRVREDDRKNENEHSSWANDPLYQAPIYQNTAKLLTNLEEYYQKEFASLVHGKLPEFVLILEKIEFIAKKLNDEAL